MTFENLNSLDILGLYHTSLWCVCYLWWLLYDDICVLCHFNISCSPALLAKQILFLVASVCLCVYLSVEKLKNCRSEIDVIGRNMCYGRWIQLDEWL